VHGFTGNLDCPESGGRVATVTVALARLTGTSSAQQKKEFHHTRQATRDVCKQLNKGCLGWFV